MTMLEETPTVEVQGKRSTDRTTPTIRSIDLFAGAGGLSLGFHLADVGHVPVFAVEHELAAAKTFERNFDCEVFAGDIEEIPTQELERRLAVLRERLDDEPRSEMSPFPESTG
jgi:hypothetical protein